MRRRKSPRSLFETLEARCLLSAAFDLVGITALRADPIYTQVDGSGVGIAVLDTGVFGNHPDIKNNFVAWFDAVTNGQAASTNHGDTNVNDTFDPEGHGTHVSGTAASSNPAIGVATHADLIDVRVFPGPNEAQPQYDTVLVGLQWVIANYTRYNIKVVNMSLGQPGVNDNFVPQLNDEARAIKQLEQLGVTVVTASGNGYGGFAQLGASVPAVYSTLQVANTWEDSGTQTDRSFIGLDDRSGNGTFGVIDSTPQADQLNASSQRSTLPNQVAAPGSTIFSTWNGDSGLMYNTIRGTSMASPLVAGEVALMQDAAFTFGGRYLTPAEIVQLARSSSDHIVDSQTTSTERFPLTQNANGQLVRAGPNEDLPETGQTFDRVNVYRAIQQVRNLVTAGGVNPNPDPGQRTADTNGTITSAGAIPSLDGTQSFSVDGKIGTDGQVQVGTDDVDLFQIVLNSPGLVTFQLSPVTGGSSFTADLRLFDSAGNELAFNVGTYPSLTSDRLAAGTYYFGVSSASNNAYSVTDGTGAINGLTQGDYQLTVSLGNPDPDGVAQGAQDVDLTNPTVFNPDTNVPSDLFSGNIGTDPNPLDPTGPAVNVGDTDVDFYQMTAPDTGVLTIDTRSQFVYGDPVDTYVRVFDENLNQIDFADDIVSFVQTDTHLALDVQQGQKYYVAVTTFGNKDFNPSDPFDRVSTTQETGQYDLYLSFSNGDVNGTVFGSVAFNSIAPSGTLNGVIGADFGTPLLSQSTNGGNKDVDFLSYTPASTGTLDLLASSPNNSFSPVVALWEFTAGQTSIVKVEDTTGTAAHISLRVQQGDAFFISVTGLGNEGFNWFAPASGSGGQTGTYQLVATIGASSNFNNLTNDSINNNQPDDIAVGASVNANIGSDGSAVVGAADIDMYRLVADQTETLQIRTETSAEGSADTFLRVFDSTGQEVAFNDNADTQTTASSISINVTAGQTYYIGVNGASASAHNYDPLTGASAADGSRGDYRLSVSQTTNLPTVSIGNASITEGNSGTTNADFAVNLSLASSDPVTIHYTTANLTALAGSDYTATSGDLTIPAGQTSGTISIPIIGDTTFEADETFNVILSSPNGASLGQATAIGTILNDDSAPVSAPEIRVFRKSGASYIEIQDNQATISFGSPRRGSPAPIRVFKVTNSGNVPLTTITLKVTTGFQIVEGLAKTLAPGVSDLFTLRMPTASLATRTGRIKITSNDANENPFRINLSGAIRRVGTATRISPTEIAAAGADALALEYQPPVGLFATTRRISDNDIEELLA